MGWVAHQIYLCSAVKTETQLLAPSLNKLPHLREKNVFLWELDVGPDKLCEGPGSVQTGSVFFFFLFGVTGIWPRYHFVVFFSSAAMFRPFRGRFSERTWRLWRNLRPEHSLVSRHAQYSSQGSRYEILNLFSLLIGWSFCGGERLGWESTLNTVRRKIGGGTIISSEVFQEDFISTEKSNSCSSSFTMA